MLGSGYRIGVSAAQAAPPPASPSAAAAPVIMNERLPSIIAVASLLYACGPRSIETGCQRLRPLVASTEELPPAPQRRLLLVTHTSPQGQPPLARRRVRVAPGGAGRKVRVNVLLCCRCCQAP